MREVDIVIPTTHRDKLIKRLDAVGVEGYTVLSTESGSGPRGGKAANLLFDATDASYIVVIASDEVAERVWNELGPYIKEHRGYASMTEVMRVLS